MVGPLRPPPDWRELQARASALAARAADPRDPCGADFTNAFSRLYSQWADAAEKEVIESTGAHFYGDPKKQGLRGKAPVLVWRSIVPERPPGDSDVNHTLWRSIAARAVEVQRALHHMIASDPGLDGLDEHEMDELAGPDADADGDQLGDVHGDARGQLDQAGSILDDIAGELDNLDIGSLGNELADAVATLRDITNDAMTTNLMLIAAQANSCHDDFHPGLAKGGDILRCLTEARATVNKGLYAAAEGGKRKGLEEWREWIRRNVDSGARHAHKYLALPEEWQPTTLLTADGVLSSNPLQLIDSYRLKYDRLWNRRAHDGDAGHTTGGGGGGGGTDARGFRRPRNEALRPSVR